MFVLIAGTHAQHDFPASTNEQDIATAVASIYASETTFGTSFADWDVSKVSTLADAFKGQGRALSQRLDRRTMAHAPVSLRGAH